MDVDKNNFIEALIKKESSSNNDEIHKLFHYTEEKYEYENSKGNIVFSNHGLSKEIDRLDNISNTDFMNNSFLKIKLLVSIRIWIEYLLYKLIPSNEEDMQSKFLSKWELSNKIDYLMPRNKTPLVNLPKKLNRDVLMSKKVMINQAVHYQSQVMPFAYAINLSLQNLVDEITEIKGYFLGN